MIFSMKLWLFPLAYSISSANTENCNFVNTILCDIILQWIIGLVWINCNSHMFVKLLVHLHLTILCIFFSVDSKLSAAYIWNTSIKIKVKVGLKKSIFCTFLSTEHLFFNREYVQGFFYSLNEENPLLCKKVVFN